MKEKDVGTITLDDAERLIDTIPRKTIFDMVFWLLPSFVHTFIWKQFGIRIIKHSHRCIIENGLPATDAEQKTIGYSWDKI